MNRTLVTRAVLTAGIAIAAQIASKAARDGIFLGTFDATDLPRAIIAATGVSVAAVMATSWAMRRFGAAATVPALFCLSAALFAFEWWLVGSYPRLGAAVVFGHVSSLGAVLISGFWALVSASFDARSARVHLGTIGLGATGGGLVGGLIAERVASAAGASTLLLCIAAGQLACAALGRGVAASEARERPGPSDTGNGLREIFANAYLRRLAVVVLLLAVVAGLLDFLLKFEAEAHYQTRDQLTRFFGGFYTGTALLAFIVQASIGRRSLERLGLATTAAALPAFLLLGGIGVLAVPGLVAAAIGRGTEIIVRGSLFRSAYELLFAPLKPEVRNQVKTWIDVGCERIGDAVAGGLVQLLLLFAATGRLIAGTAIALAACALAAVVWSTRDYVGEVAGRLEDEKLPEGVDVAMATMGLSNVDLSRILAGKLDVIRAETEASAPPAAEPSAPLPLDPYAQRLVQLRSTDSAVVLTALEPPLSALVVPAAVDLLGRDDAADRAAAALRDVAGDHVGQLVDSLMDSSRPGAARTRLPAIIASAGGERASHGLLTGLGARRLDVRLRTVEALFIHRAALTGLDETNLTAAIRDELTRPSHHTFSGRLSRKGIAFPQRKTGLPHVYILLTLVAMIRPPEPVANAYRALQTDDKKLRGLALEYLVSVLPADLRDDVLARLDSATPEPEAPPRGAATLEQTMMLSREAIDAALRNNDGDG